MRITATWKRSSERFGRMSICRAFLCATTFWTSRVNGLRSTASNWPSSAAPVSPRWRSSDRWSDVMTRSQACRRNLLSIGRRLIRCSTGRQPRRSCRSATFLRREVVPRREAVLSIAQGIEELNNANLAAQSAEVASRHTALRNDLRRLTWQTVLLGLAVALVVVFRLRFLERRSDEAEQHMRELSQQLVNTQEEERKSLSRELHDHVAQVLTGLRMELGRVERIAAPLDARVGPAVAECKGLVDDMFNTVRGLALGLRPSMLDDFGLQAALEWHVRDFTGRYAMNVDLKMDGDFDALPDKHRTCVYRVVQEALTNCARHAHAQNVKVSVQARDGHLQVSVTDDGVGLNPIRRRNGLGLRGIDERVRELEGTMTISREAGGGTTVAVQLPLPAGITEVPRARAAG